MWKYISLAMACLCLHHTATGRKESNTGTPVFLTKYGNVRGTVMQSRSNRSFAAFRGIPYAKPPVGDLRFKAPIQPDPWPTVYNATSDADICIQQNYFLEKDPKVKGSEDCLYLNVYTPKLTRQLRRGDKLYPVMVFIHYSAFIAGSSRSDVLGPEYFLDEDVVLVTFNYRIGVFGFLSTYDDAAPGNWAFKDQVAVLRWVRDNIVYFGGDNRKVTLFGQSAGGGSTHYHILSPLSKGLFQAAITQSGSALALWAKPQTVFASIVAKTQAFVVGCRNDTDSYTMVNCLRNVPAEQLVLSADLFRFIKSEPLTVFTSTVEKQSEENPEPFITEDPVEIINKREFNDVPWIIGVVSDEGIFRAAPFVLQQDVLHQINTNLDAYLPKMLALDLSVSEDQKAETWAKIKKFYFPEGAINTSSPNSVQRFIDLYSDRGFDYSVYQMALWHSLKGHRPIWFYYFDYRGKLTYGELFALTNATIDFDWGVSHCDDLLYLFPSPKLLPKLPKEDFEMSRIMISIFTTFAKCRDPSSSEFLRLGEGWSPIPDLSLKEIAENTDLHHLKISGPHRGSNGSSIRMEMTREFLPKRMMFWEKLPLLENIKGLH